MKNPSISLLSAHVVVCFYRFWHGILGLKGAGKLINHLAPRLAGLQNYPLRLPNGKIAEVDFRELSAFGWLNTILGDQGQEDALVDVIAARLSRESVFWDIGANAGILSAQIAARSDVLEHHFFEPNPRIFSWAQKALEHLPTTHGHPFAVSSKSGMATLAIPHKGSAYGSLEKFDLADADQIEVETVTGDELVYFQNFAPPDIIKIDTEGHEAEVITGMKRLLAQHRPLVFFEHIELSDEQLQKMVPEGYSLATLSDKTGQISKSFERSIGHNSVLTPKAAP